MRLKSALNSRSLRRTRRYDEGCWIDPSKTWFGSSEVLHKRWRQTQTRMNVRLEEAIKIELAFWKKLVRSNQKVADVGVFRSATRRIRDLSRDLNLPESEYRDDLVLARRRWCLFRAQREVQGVLNWCRDQPTWPSSLAEARKILRQGKLTLTDIDVSLPNLEVLIRRKARREAKKEARQHMKLLRTSACANRKSQRWLSTVWWAKKTHKLSDRELGLRKGELEKWDKIVFPPSQ